MTQSFKILIIPGIIAGLLAGCGDIGSDEDTATYLARVGSDYLTIKEARRDVNAFALAKDSIRTIRLYREHWIHRKLMLREANSLQLAQQPEIRDRLQKAREEVLLNGVKDAVTAQNENQAQVSDEEARRYYRQHNQQLILNERYVQYTHIENRDLSTVQTARRALQNDSSWAAVVRRYSLNPRDKIKRAGKFWPVSSRFNNIPIMKQYVSELDSGQVSPIQRHEGMYHVVQLRDIRTQGDTADPDWFIDELKEWLVREKRRKYYNTYVKNLYFKAKENNELELFNVSSPNINDNIDTTKIN